MKYKTRNRKLSDIDRDWINQIPKIIDRNGCWIPKLSPTPDGYVTITVESKPRRLHRLVVCVYFNIEYLDASWESRHSKDCNRACFNPEHLNPGSISENVKDSVQHGTHQESKRKLCNFGHRLDGLQKNKGSYSRYCKTCKRLRGKKKVKI